MSLKNRWALLKAAFGSGQPAIVHTHLYLDGEEVRTVIADAIDRNNEAVADSFGRQHG